MWSVAITTAVTRQRPWAKQSGATRLTPKSDGSRALHLKTSPNPNLTIRVSRIAATKQRLSSVTLVKSGPNNHLINIRGRLSSIRTRASVIITTAGIPMVNQVSGATQLTSINDGIRASRLKNPNRWRRLFTVMVLHTVATKRKPSQDTHVKSGRSMTLGIHRR